MPPCIPPSKYCTIIYANLALRRFSFSRASVNPLDVRKAKISVATMMSMRFSVLRMPQLSKFKEQRKTDEMQMRPPLAPSPTPVFPPSTASRSTSRRSSSIPNDRTHLDSNLLHRLLRKNRAITKFRILDRSRSVVVDRDRVLSRKHQQNSTRERSHLTFSCFPCAVRLKSSDPRMKRSRSPLCLAPCSSMTKARL